MKFVFLMGGAAGFAVAAGASYFSGREPDRVFLDGAVGCLAGSLLFRWCWNALLRGIRETYLERQRVATEAAKAAAPAPGTPAVPKPSPERTGLLVGAGAKSRIS